MQEIWKDIEDYEGLYQVSNLGRLMSLNYRKTGKAKLRKLNERKDGYQMVLLSKNGKKDLFFIHRLVAEAFLPNPENKPQVNHKIEGDEGKKINIVYLNEDGTIDYKKTTIEWVTVKENINYGTHNQRAAKIQSKAVLQFTLDGEFVREWSSMSECERNGFRKSAVCRCCNGKLPHYKGFLWMYK